eukprot:1207716-Prorocentrum_lima.AAC.1
MKDLLHRDWLGTSELRSMVTAASDQISQLSQALTVQSPCFPGEHASQVSGHPVKSAVAGKKHSEGAAKAKDPKDDFLSSAQQQQQQEPVPSSSSAKHVMTARGYGEA